jgi:hypothetical protein
VFIRCGLFIERIHASDDVKMLTPHGVVKCDGGMMTTPRRWILALTYLVGVAGFAGWASPVFGQVETQPWGNLRGIRVDGELVPFTTGIRAVPDGSILGEPSLEKLAGAGNAARASYARDGDRQTIRGAANLYPPMEDYEVAQISDALRKLLSSNPAAKTVLENNPTLPLITPPAAGRGGAAPAANPSVTTSVIYEDAGPGTVNVNLQASANPNVSMEGVYYYIHLAQADYRTTSVELIEPSPRTTNSAAPDTTTARLPSGMAKGVAITWAHRHLDVVFAEPIDITVEETTSGPNAGVHIYFPIHAGNLAAGENASLAFTLKASADADKSPVNLALDLAHPGSPFDGVGGNFRIQSNADAAHIQYNLANLRVAWGRVNLPLNNWQPNENTDPTQAANANLNTQVRQAMEMAQTLDKQKIPIVISVWDAPNWALMPLATPRPPGGGGGSTKHYDFSKFDEFCQSVGSYLQYLKDHYGVEPKYFSFNESDIGYSVLETAQEHDEAIRRLGAYLATHGFATKMVLGDTGDPTGIDFINAAMADPEAVKYIGAVSYHAWRGGTVEQYTRWGAAAKKLQVPLLIAEGGTDSDAYYYPTIMLEPWYALNEIGEYIDICRISQPLSILEWQLTENYSILTGGTGGQPLQPAQRFWELKQLDATPKGSQALPISCDKPAVSPCAFMDPASGTCTVHLVNTGATRAAVITGLPANIKEMRVYVTDGTRGMKEMDRVAVSSGVAQFTLDSMSYTTLMNAP